MHRFFVRFTLVVGIALLGSVSSHAGNLFATDGVANWQGVYVGIHGGAGLGSAGTLTTGGTLYGAHGSAMSKPLRASSHIRRNAQRAKRLAVSFLVAAHPH